MWSNAADYDNDADDDDDDDDDVDDDEDGEDDDYDNSYPGGVVSQGSLTVPPTKPLVDLMTGPAVRMMIIMILNCYHDEQYENIKEN